MKLSEYQRSRSFFDLVKGHSDFKVKLFDFGRYTQVSDPGPHGPLVFLVMSHVQYFENSENWDTFSRMISNVDLIQTAIGTV